MPDDDPEGNPQCFKEQKEDDMIETVYDASMLLVQVLRIIYIQYSWIENQNWNERVDWYMFLAHQYLVPVLVMAYTNGMIAYTLWKKREIGEVHVKVVFLWNWCESLKFQLRLPFSDSVSSPGSVIAACDEEEPDVEIQTEGDQMKINLLVPRGWMCWIVCRFLLANTYVSSVFITLLQNYNSE